MKGGSTRQNTEGTKGKLLEPRIGNFRIYGLCPTFCVFTGSVAVFVTGIENQW